MSGIRRYRLLDRLGATVAPSRGVLSNARCLTEGVDVPSLDGVAFIDPRRSQVDVVQAVGRAIRKTKDKSLGTIVLPVFLAADETAAEQVLDSSAFKPIVQVLRALRDHDDALADELDGLRRELGRRGSLDRLPGKLQVIAPESVDAEFVRAPEARAIELSTRSWEFWFGLLERYVDREGSAWVPFKHVEAVHNLGAWVVEQRLRRTQLGDVRASRLAAPPGWSWKTKQGTWDARYEALQTFVAREGHTFVPKSHVEIGVNLGLWVSNQRSRRRLLSPERAARLERTTGWTWDAADFAWNEMLARLEGFSAREGHADVPQSYSEDGVGLGSWVSHQRELYRSGRLPEQRVGRLEQIKGWRWDSLEDAWRLGIEHLQRFADRERHTLIPRAYVEGDYPLGKWVEKRRSAYRRGQLDDDRVRQLEAFPDWSWNPKSEAWDRHFVLLEQFTRREGHAKVPTNHVEDGQRLGWWAVNQRAFYRRGELDDEQWWRVTYDGVAAGSPEQEEA
jgi:hypothetical protein